MNVKDAVAIRIQELCDERQIRIYELATLAGVTPSTVYSMVNDTKRREVRLSTVKKLCDGIEISLPEFFDAPVFLELDQEIS